MSRLKKADKYLNENFGFQDENYQLLSLLNMLRENLKDELDTTQKYEQHIQAIQIQEISDLLRHIVKEEREHVRELSGLIEKYEKKYEVINKK